MKPCALCAGRKCRCQRSEADEWGLNGNIYYGVFLRPGLPGDEAISSSPVGVCQLQNRLDPDTGRETGSCMGAGPVCVVVGSLGFSHRGILERVWWENGRFLPCTGNWLHRMVNRKALLSAHQNSFYQCGQTRRTHELPFQRTSKTVASAFLPQTGYWTGLDDLLLPT